MRRGFLLGGVTLLCVGFTVWAFTGSSFGTWAAVTGALGAAALGLAVFGRVQRGAARRGVPAIVGTQVLYLALWVAGGLLWAGPLRELPHFASPVQLSLEELQGRWTREDGQVHELRGTFLCWIRTAEQPISASPADPCLRLIPKGRGFSLLMDDVAVPLRAYRRWGREFLNAGMFDLIFSRLTSEAEQ